MRSQVHAEAWMGDAVFRSSIAWKIPSHFHYSSTLPKLVPNSSKFTGPKNEFRRNREQYFICMEIILLLLQKAPFLPHSIVTTNLDDTVSSAERAKLRQMGYPWGMLLQPSQTESSNKFNSRAAADFEWAQGAVKTFEKKVLAKGKVAMTFKGEMVDTPVYDNARTILAITSEIAAFDEKRKKA